MEGRCNELGKTEKKMFKSPYLYNRAAFAKKRNLYIYVLYLILIFKLPHPPTLDFTNSKSRSNLY